MRPTKSSKSGRKNPLVVCHWIPEKCSESSETGYMRHTDLSYIWLALLKWDSQDRRLPPRLGLTRERCAVATRNNGRYRPWALLDSSSLRSGWLYWKRCYNFLYSLMELQAAKESNMTGRRVAKCYEKIPRRCYGSQDIIYDGVPWVFQTVERESS